MSIYDDPGLADELAKAEWRRSSTSDEHKHGVEVAIISGPRWAVRDSRDPDGPVLLFTEAEWVAFSLGAKAGEFDTEAGLDDETEGSGEEK